MTVADDSVEIRVSVLQYKSFVCYPTFDSVGNSVLLFNDMKLVLCSHAVYKSFARSVDATLRYRYMAPAIGLAAVTVAVTAAAQQIQHPRLALLKCRAFSCRANLIVVPCSHENFVVFLCFIVFRTRSLLETSIRRHFFPARLVLIPYKNVHC